MSYYPEADNHITDKVKVVLYLLNYASKKELKHAAGVNPIQDGVGAKRPPTSFSPVTSTNLGLSLQNFLTFSFNPFATLV